MENSTALLVQNIVISITAAIALVTLILNIVKMHYKAKGAPYRRRLEYINDFGDFLVNQAKGTMIISEIEFLYNGEEVNYTSLVGLYTDKLMEIYGDKFKVIWSTFISNDELIGKYLMAKDEIKLVEIIPEEYKNQYPDLSDNLYCIREKIAIKLTYKNIYGRKKTVTL